MVTEVGADATGGGSRAILVFHGSRRPSAVSEAGELVARVAAMVVDVGVSFAFLERAEPSIEAELERLVAAGPGPIVVLPVFVLTGAHVESDLPAVVAAVRARHPDRVIILRAHLAAEPGFATLLAGLIGGDPAAPCETDVSRRLTGANAPSWRAPARRSCGSRGGNGTLPPPVVGDG